MRDRERRMEATESAVMLYQSLVLAVFFKDNKESLYTTINMKGMPPSQSLLREAHFDFKNPPMLMLSVRKRRYTYRI